LFYLRLVALNGAVRNGWPLQPSTSSNPVVIYAVLPSMMLAEQYLSWLMAMALSTATG